MGGRDHSCEVCGRGGFNDPGGSCICVPCSKCEGDGSYSELADCTTFDKDCACNGPRAHVDPCERCNGSGLDPDCNDQAT